jgi:exosortase
VIQQLALPALLLGVAWSLFGWRGFIALLAPIGVLYFVLPVWDYIRTPLQSMTVVAVGESLHAIGIPAYIHGYRVDLPGGSFEVVEGCSGLHFFMAAGALALSRPTSTWALSGLAPRS